jgi:hypothetical protein
MPHPLKITGNMSHMISIFTLIKRTHVAVVALAHCCLCAGIVAIITGLALPPSLCWRCVSCCANVIVALDSTPRWAVVVTVIVVAMASLPPPSHLLRLVVVSPLVALFLLCRCLLTRSLRLLPPICIPFSLAGCCVNSSCATSA